MADKFLQHRGYLGSVQMSLEDNCLYGEVLFINDLVNYEAQTPEQLQTAFAEAVDDYLKRCEAEGLDPDKPCSGTFNVRLTPELHRAACCEAVRNGTTLNDYVKEAVQNAVSRQRPVVNELHHHTHVHHQVSLSDEGSFGESAPGWLSSQENRKSTH